MRNEVPTLQDAVRYIPFVGIDFLTGKIPLNPADDFRNDSAKCRLCEFIYGTIVKIYPAEYLEQHTQRSKEFLRIFLADKAQNQKQIAYKEEDPDWVDPVTGKKSVGGRQWRFIDQGYGDTIEGKEHVYGDVSYNIYRRRKRLKKIKAKILQQNIIKLRKTDRFQIYVNVKKMEHRRVPLISLTEFKIGAAYYPANQHSVPLSLFPNSFN